MARIDNPDILSFPIPLAGLRAAQAGPRRSLAGERYFGEKFDSGEISAEQFQVQLDQIFTNQSPSKGVRANAPLGYFPGAQIAENISFTPTGMYKRYGHDLWTLSGLTAPTTEDQLGIYDFRKKDTTTRKLVVATPTRLLTVPLGGAYQTALKSGMSTDKFVNFATMNDQMIAVNGQDAPQVWDGVSASTSDLIEKTQETITSLPTAASNGALFVLGAGFDVHSVTEQAHQKLVPRFGTWTAIPKPTAWDGSRGGSVDRFGFICGGWKTGPFTPAASSSLAQYDSALETWEAKAAMTAAKLQHCCFTVERQLYEAGGNTVSEAAPTESSTTNRYDEILDLWEARGALNTARRGLAGFELGGFGYTAGGMVGTGPIVYSNVSEIYDPGLDTWTATAVLNTARALLDGAAGANGFGYVMGGTDGSESSVVEEYDRVANTWSASVALPVATSEIGVALSDKHIYSVGGDIGGTAQTPAYRLNTAPAAPICRYIAVHKSTLFMFGDPNAPNRLYYFDPGQINHRQNDGYLDIQQNDGDWGTGLFRFGEELYAAKRDAIYRITGDIFHPDPTIGDVSFVFVTSPGAVNQESIVVTDAGVFFRAEDGFYHFDGTTAQNISDGAIDEGSTDLHGLNLGLSGVWDKHTQEIRWYPGRRYLETWGTSQTVDFFWPVLHVPTVKWSIHKFARPGRGAMVAGMVEDATTDESSIVIGIRSDFSSFEGRLMISDTGLTDLGSQRVQARYQTTPFSPGRLLDETTIHQVLLSFAGMSTIPYDFMIRLQSDSGQQESFTTAKGPPGAYTKLAKTGRVDTTNDVHGYSFIIDIMFLPKLFHAVVTGVIAYFAQTGGGRKIRGEGKPSGG